jgi:hypothetical protein
MTPIFDTQNSVNQPIIIEEKEQIIIPDEEEDKIIE